MATLSEERMKYLRQIPEGGNWRDLPADQIKGAMGGAYTSGGGKAGFYRRLSFNQPSSTVVTSPVQKATNDVPPNRRSTAIRPRMRKDSAIP